jgi:hypothetical protein
MSTVTLKSAYAKKPSARFQESVLGRIGVAALVANFILGSGAMLIGALSYRVYSARSVDLSIKKQDESPQRLQKRYVNWVKSGALVTAVNSCFYLFLRFNFSKNL